LTRSGLIVTGVPFFGASMLVLMASESAKKRTRPLGHAGVGAAVALSLGGVFFLGAASRVPMTEKERAFHEAVALGSLLRTLQVVRSKAWQTASPTRRLRSFPLFVVAAYEMVITVVPKSKKGSRSTDFAQQSRER
jgi:hypothetical protein